MRYLFLFLFLITTQNVWSQKESFLDERDNITYSIVEVNGTTWFQENIRYQTPNSFCQGDKLKVEHCQYGNYYPYTELEEVCPSGWHVSTLKEWEDIINYLISIDSVEQTVNKDSIENGTVIVLIDPIHILNEASPLLLKELGWVQGNRLRKKQLATLWIKNETTNDARYHVHFSDNGYSKHAHAHNIQETKRKNRRFSVRCVKDEQ